MSSLPKESTRVFLFRFLWQPYNRVLLEIASLPSKEQQVKKIFLKKKLPLPGFSKTWVFPPQTPPILETVRCKEVFEPALKSLIKTKERKTAITNIHGRRCPLQFCLLCCSFERLHHIVVCKTTKTPLMRRSSQNPFYCFSLSAKTKLFQQQNLCLFLPCTLDETSFRSVLPLF